MNPITIHQRAVVFIDYDAIYWAIKRYGVDSLQLNFIPSILDHIRNTQDLDVIETIIYADFEYLPAHHQTYLRQLGFNTRHCKNKGSGSLYIAVEAVVMLYDNPVIDVFVFITGLNELIPALSTIRYKNKFIYCLTLKENIDQALLNCSDLHEYLDDIFGFEPPGQWKVEINRSGLTYEDVKRARLIAKLFYDSHIWKKSEATGQPVTLKGYLPVIHKVIKGDISQLTKAFEIAHFLRYVTIYQSNETLYLKRGERYQKVAPTLTTVK